MSYIIKRAAIVKTFSNIGLGTFLLIFFFIFSNFLTKNYQREKIHVKEGNYTIETQIINSEKKIRINNELTYYWFKNRSIGYTRGGYAGSLLDGKYQKFDSSKNLIEQGTFKKGLKIGVWKQWHANGELNTLSHYRNGLQHGLELSYDTNGIVISENKFHKGTIKL